MGVRCSAYLFLNQKSITSGMSKAEPHRVDVGLGASLGLTGAGCGVSLGSGVAVSTTVNGGIRRGQNLRLLSMVGVAVSQGKSYVTIFSHHPIR